MYIDNYAAISSSTKDIACLSKTIATSCGNIGEKLNLGRHYSQIYRFEVHQFHLLHVYIQHHSISAHYAIYCNK